MQRKITFSTLHFHTSLSLSCYDEKTPDIALVYPVNLDLIHIRRIYGKLYRG